MLTKILVNTDRGEMLIDAYKHGKFAVNLPPSIVAHDPTEARWHITHIATGRVVARKWGRAPARKLARELDAATKTDITLDDYANETAVWKAFVDTITPIVRQ